MKMTQTTAKYERYKGRNEINRNKIWRHQTDPLRQNKTQFRNLRYPNDLELNMQRYNTVRTPKLSL